MFQRALVLPAIAALSLSLPAQSPHAFGTVSGYVYCNDTNAPARLASVTLRPVTAAKVAASSKSDLSTGVEARVIHTLLDGSFTIPKVAPGTYYVIASMEGYVSPLAVLAISNSDLLDPTEDVRKSLLKVVPTVTVEASQTASVNIGLQRGGSIGGTILFEDGSPAPGLEVDLLTRKKDKWVHVETGAADGMSGSARTDDRGAYRISSIPPGEQFLIKVVLSIANFNVYYGKGGTSYYSQPDFTLSFYTGGTLRPSAAKPFALTLGEERPGEDIVLPLSKLHRLQGAVVAQHDGHILNQATVQLLFADDQSPLGGTALSKDDSRFSFAFVPEGDYILRVSNAGDARYDDIPNPPGSVPPTHSETHTLRTYGSIDLPIHIESDRLDLSVPVPDKAPPKP